MAGIDILSSAKCFLGRFPIGLATADRCTSSSPWTWTWVDVNSLLWHVSRLPEVIAPNGHFLHAALVNAKSGRKIKGELRRFVVDILAKVSPHSAFLFLLLPFWVSEAERGANICCLSDFYKPGNFPERGYFLKPDLTTNCTLALTVYMYLNFLFASLSGEWVFLYMMTMIFAFDACGDFLLIFGP